MLGVFQKCELILTMQCGDPEKEELLHAFRNVMESLKIQAKKEEGYAD